MNQPPQSEYTQAEAYAPMETAASEAAAALPGFPGFHRRSWAELPCSHDGIDDPEHTTVEIRYEFSIEDSGTDSVRSEYVDVLRDLWTGQGNEVTEDSQTTRGERLDRELVAVRDDGINLWYSVTGIVVLFIQSGCVPVSDPSEIEYIPPVGGIEPGSENDLVGDYFPDGIPTDQAAAVDPFADAQAIGALVPFTPPESYEDLL
ncbi:hypothetical protein [Glycomyces sp. MUSA5-2]|uniref:hypothetical protein n=1 Tax=Glycomyces sp. MUSA5-2 TaxID=2053002 RepID=UPI00300A15CC